MIKRLAVVSIPVRDQDRSKAWYRHVLGFCVVRDTPFRPDARWIQLAPEGAETSISLVTWFPAMRPGCVQGLALDTNGIEAERRGLIARDLQLGEVQPSPWGRYLTLEDPDGNGWVLMERPAF